MGGAFSTVCVGRLSLFHRAPILKASTVISRSCRSEGVRDSRDSRDKKTDPDYYPCYYFSIYIKYLYLLARIVGIK